MLNPISPLVEQFVKLPGVGQKSAQRLAFFILSMSVKEVDLFSSVLSDIRRRVTYCERCFNLSMEPLCSICANPKRDVGLLCVVADPKDIYSIERTLEFNGVYHGLGGLISPLDGVSPEGIRIAELVARLRSGGFLEVVLALNSTIEGEATMLYLTSVLKGFSVRLTKLAYGLPIGGDLEYADELTLQRALVARTVV